VIGERKPKYLVKWKEYIVNEDTCKELENLENIKKLVKKFKKKIRIEELRRVQWRKQKLLNPEAKVLRKSELLRKYIIKILLR